MSCTGCCTDTWWTREELRRWTDNIQLLLISPRGRKCFQEHLTSNTFLDAEMKLAFWEMVDDLYQQIRQGNIEWPEASRKLRKIYLHADEHSNFDAAQMRKLRNCMKLEDNSEIIKLLSETKEWTVNDLRDDYKVFVESKLKDLATK